MSEDEFPPTTEDLIETFDLFDLWEERYEYLIELGRDLPKMDLDLQTAQTKVEGCMSSVWLVSQLRDDHKVNIVADSDSIIVKGLIVVLLAAFQNKSPKEIIDFDIEELFSKIGLDQHLSPNRRNGLFSMVKRIRSEAIEHESV